MPEATTTENLVQQILDVLCRLNDTVDKFRADLTAPSLPAPKGIVQDIDLDADTIAQV